MLKYKEALLYLLFIVVAFVYIATKTVPKVFELVTSYKTKNEKTIQTGDLEAKLEELKNNEKTKAANAVELKKIYKQDSPNMDTETSFTVTFEDIINMAKYNGVKVFSLKYTYNPPDDEFVSKNGGSYNVCQLDMELVSDYQDFESFLQELFKYPYLINIDKIELMAYPKNKRILLIKLKLKLYTKK